MNKKIFSMFLICSLLMVTNFDASEVNHAPVHPTSEEVEAAAATDLVEFNDDILEQALADKLGVAIGEITVGDMESLTELKFFNRGISDLTGLEYATNLVTLSLQDNQIDDIDPLSGLTNLTYLDLSYNQIDNIEPLSGLTNLTVLYLGDNQIDDISPLSGLTNLIDLEMFSNQIDDISPLSGLTNLTFLYLADNQIESEDLEALSGLTNLTSLNLVYNQIDDVEALSGLINLDRLTLYENQIDNVEALSGLTNLTSLDLSYNQVSDISPLSGLTNLTDLDLHRQQVNLEDITVNSSDELFYNVIDINGDEHPVSLGIPELGTFEMTGEWNIATSVGSVTDRPFTGTTTQTVTYEMPTIESESDVEGSEVEETTKSETDSETGNEVESETGSESSQISLATTGSISSLALAIGLISIMGLTSIKRATNK